MIAGGVVGFAQEVVDAGVVDAGELDEDGGGDVALASFIFGIACLRHIEHFCNFGLVPIVVFS